jgi:putative transposase
MIKMEIRMARKKGQTYTAEQKTKIVLELLKEEQTVAELASRYKISSASILKWKKQFLENASLAFDVGGATKAYRDEIEDLKVQNDDLAKALGKATIKAEWASGKLKSLDFDSKKSLIESKHKNISVSEQCKILGISRSSYYYKEVPMSQTNIKLLHKIDEIATDNSEYGYRYIHQQLLEDGYSIGKNRVLKYMGILGIQAIYPTKKKLTSIKNQDHKIYEYLLKPYWSRTGRTKQVYVPTPNEVWSGDITYIRTNNGFMYLAAVIDWHTKAILAYKISNSMDATLATDVLQEALAKYPKPKIFNSDQGSQYTSHEHTELLKQHDIQISMNGRGRSIDNIVIERFFRTLKHGNIYISDYQSIKELKEGVKAYMHKYNFKRFHSSIGYQNPMNYYLEYIKSVG